MLTNYQRTLRRGAPAGAALLWMLFVAFAGYRTLLAQTLVKLTLPAYTATAPAAEVEIPVHLETAGQKVSGVLFSVDYDPRCLEFEGADADGNGLPDGIQPLTPPQFSFSAAFNPADEQGEIDVVLLDLSVPFAELPTGPLAILRFTTTCIPAAGGAESAVLRFSDRPSPSFGDPLGKNVAGVWAGGIIDILDAAAPPATFTPTPTPYASATATPTATATNTPVTPDPGATPPTEPATPTPTATSEPLLPPVPPTPTPTRTPTATPPPTSRPEITPATTPEVTPEVTPSGQNAGELFLPLIQRG
jgi:hypothetical protein